MNCPGCGRAITPERDEAYCPYCGSAIGGRRVRGWFRAAVLGLVTMILVSGLLFGVGALAAKYVGRAGSVSGEVSRVSLSLAEHEGLLYPGDTAKLAMEFYPEVRRAPELSWSSSDESVAVIDETGLVSILSEGEAEITVVLSNGVSASLPVKAQKKPELLTLGETGLIIKKGETRVLEAVAAPSGSAYGSIEWKSSNTKVLTVDGNGIIKGVSRGRARVTAKLDCGVEAETEVFVYEYGFDVLADLIASTGEFDSEAECFFRVLDHEQETNEDGLLIHRYTELIYFPDEDAISVCCDIYDDDVTMYYETCADIYRDERYNAYISFQCAMDTAGLTSHMTPLSSGTYMEAEGGGGFYLPNYTPGCSAVFHWYDGDSTFRETAQQISDEMLGYSMLKLKEKWPELGLPFTYAEILNLDSL
ncbi:MAG: Ig-like domain-containing protein [Clostridia bacterium]|nr:Ig-like domain-containing protein [Clostridia bacterium]